MLSKVSADEVKFVKGLRDYDEGSGMRASGTELVLDWLTLRLTEQSTFTIARDSTSKASEAYKTSSTIQVRCKSTG